MDNLGTQIPSRPLGLEDLKGKCIPSNPRKDLNFQTSLKFRWKMTLTNARSMDVKYGFMRIYLYTNTGNVEKIFKCYIFT